MLGFLVSELLLRRHPDSTEGKLSKLKSRLVSEVQLFAVAQAIGLGAFLILGRGEEMNGGRTKRALLADAGRDAVRDAARRRSLSLVA